jgi:hypothetical protein
MCGLCSESHALEIMDAGGDLSMHPGFPLMEGNLQEELKSEKPLGEGENALVLCRLLEYLVTEGFNAPMCRQLLAMPVVVRAIEEQCTAEKRERLKSFGFHEEDIELLYHSATYLAAEGWARLRSERDCLSAVGDKGLAWFIERYFVPHWTDVNERT